MKVVVTSPPRTIMEVFKMLPEGTNAEIVNGQLYMSPTPSPRHQRMVAKLYRGLFQFIDANDLGEVFIAPTDIYLDDEANAVQPDLFFISNESPIRISDDKPIIGTPDLVVEVLSPSNNKHDLEIKKDLYEKFGVKEYWIVDPFTSEVKIYQLNQRVFRLQTAGVNKFFSPLLKHEFEF